MNIKKVILIIVISIIIVLGLVFIFKPKANSNVDVYDESKINIVASNFASYDFLRAITKDVQGINLTFLLGPGKDSHSYDPTAQDIIKIQKSDLFIYVGGEMESWADKVMESLDDTKTKKLCIADYVDKLNEEEIDGAEEEEEEKEGAFDEHIWTSPSNAIKMVEILEKSMEELDEKNREKFLENANAYIEQIKDVDSKIKEIIDSKVRSRLIFGDKMPMQYFVKYYGLDVSAAFSGCSTEVEPSAKTITYLVSKVKEDNIPVVLYIELNSGNVARTIATEAGNGATAMQIQSLHNVSLDDFKNGETWVSLMTRNIDVLKKALL